MEAGRRRGRGNGCTGRDRIAIAGVPRDRLHVMPNGVDPDLFSPQSIDVAAKARLGLERFIVLGFTGFVRDWNGLDAVLEYLARPEGQGSCLLVVGDGPARPRLEAIARSLQVVDRVHFTGLVGRSQVPRLVSAFDVALQPAANPYASPLKLFEYMALGRAIVAPDQPNIREILANERDALLFDPNDLHSFAAAVLRAAADAALRQRLAAGAVETLRHRNLTWRHNAERVLALASRLVVAKRNATGGTVVRLGHGPDRGSDRQASCRHPNLDAFGEDRCVCRTFCVQWQDHLWRLLEALHPRRVRLRVPGLHRVDA